MKVIRLVSRSGEYFEHPAEMLSGVWEKLTNAHLLALAICYAVNNGVDGESIISAEIIAE